MKYLINNIKLKNKSNTIYIIDSPYIKISSTQLFNLKQIKKENPNKLIVSNLYEIETNFFIRPEDIDIYNQYIDIIDLTTETPNRQLTLYKIYEEDKAFPGNLKFLFPQLNIDAPNQFIPKSFAKIRINCRIPASTCGKSCRFCQKALETAQILSTSGILFDKKEKI